jgi:3-hydroxyacyl-CoA dehydrogenase
MCYPGGILNNYKQVTVVGAGMMGPGIAASAALAGHPVVIVHRSPGSADRAEETIQRNLSQLVDGRLIDQAQADSAMQLVRLESDLETERIILGNRVHQRRPGGQTGPF